MNAINQNDVTECEICFENKTDYIPLMTCTHAHTFCEECVKYWLTRKYSTCPKCRIKLPLQNYLVTTGQVGINIADVSITMEYDPSSAIDLTPSNHLPLTNGASSTTSCSMVEIVYNLLLLFVILLVYLLIYWFSTLI